MSVRMQRNKGRRAPQVRQARSRLAQRHYRQRIVFSVLLLVFAIFITGLITWGSYRERFAITDIRIEGTQEVSEHQVREVTRTLLYDGRYHFLSPRNILFYPRDRIQINLLEQLPQLASVDVSLSSLRERVLVIRASERVAYGIWCDSGGQALCYRLDDEGFIFASADAFAEYPRLFGELSSTDTPIGQYFLPGEFAGIPALISALSAAGYDTFSLTALGAGDFEIKLVGEGAMRLRASFSQSVDEIVGNLQTVLASDALQGKKTQVDYVDLRFGNRVYFKLQEE